MLQTVVTDQNLRSRGERGSGRLQRYSKGKPSGNNCAGLVGKHLDQTLRIVQAS